VQRVFDLALLHDELAPEAALRLIAIWRASRNITDHKTPLSLTHENKPRSPLNQQPEGNAAARRPAPLSRPNILWDKYANSRESA
jgi:hypothetical protein